MPTTCTVPARCGLGVGPRDAAFDGEVDLERARAVAEPPVSAGDPSGQTIPEDVGDGSRRQVDRSRRPAGVGHRLDASAGFDLAAEIDQQRCQSVGDRREPPSATAHPWRWPAVRIPSPIAEVIG